MNKTSAILQSLCFSYGLDVLRHPNNAKPFSLGASNSAMKITTNHFILFIALFFFICNIGFSQKANRHFIDSSLMANDTAYKLTNDCTYVINGISYDTADVNNVLSKFETKHLLDAIYWNGSKQGHYPFYGDAVIIKFAHKQKSKQKSKALVDAKNLFNDKSTNPVLIIDKTVIDKINSKKVFQSLRLKDIMYIDKIKLTDQYYIRVWKFS